MEVGSLCCHNSFDAELGGFMVDGLRITEHVSMPRNIIYFIKFGHEGGAGERHMILHACIREICQRSNPNQIRENKVPTAERRNGSIYV